MLNADDIDRHAVKIREQIDLHAADAKETIAKLRAEIERLKQLADDGQLWRRKYEAYQDTPEAKERAKATAKANLERLAKELEAAKERDKILQSL